MPPENTPARTISIFPLLVVSFIGTLGYGIVLPSLVYIVQRFHGGDFLYGALGASYSAFELIGAPIFGKLSDQFGRKRLLFFSVLGSALAWVLFIVAFRLPMTVLGAFTTSITGAVSLTLPMLAIFIARSVDGLTAGDISVANAYIADISTEDKRKADFGKMGVAGNVGFILGPALAGILAQTRFGLILPIATAFAISCSGLVLIFFFLPESHPRHRSDNTEEVSGNKHSGKMTLRTALELDHIALLLAIYFVFFLAFSLFVVCMPLYATESLHWTIAETGIFFTILSVVIVITEGPILSWCNKRITAERLTIWGTFIVALSYVSLLVPNPGFAYAAAVLYALGNGLMWPSYLSILSMRAGSEHQGYIQGLGNSAGSLASIAGLFFGGILFSAMKETVFIIPAILVFVVFLLAWRLRGG